MFSNFKNVFKFQKLKCFQISKIKMFSNFKKFELGSILANPLRRGGRTCSGFFSMLWLEMGTMMSNGLTKKLENLVNS